MATTTSLHRGGAELIKASSSDSEWAAATRLLATAVNKPAAPTNHVGPVSGVAYSRSGSLMLFLTSSRGLSLRTPADPTPQGECVPTSARWQWVGVTRGGRLIPLNHDSGVDKMATQRERWTDAGRQAGRRHSATKLVIVKEMFRRRLSTGRHDDNTVFDFRWGRFPLLMSSPYFLSGHNPLRYIQPSTEYFHRLANAIITATIKK